MGMSTGNSGGGRRRYQPLAEINVTPFVDVMLVLLIVFMITAPLLTVGVEVNLPDSRAKALAQDQRPLEVTITKDGTIYIQETEIRYRELVARLDAIAENGKDTNIYIRGDEAIDYGRVLQVMGAINAAGYRKVALVAEPER